jgi:hypothetical protein
MVVLIGAIIPAVFNTLGGQDSGGMVLIRAFEGYNRFVIGAMAIMCAGSWYRWWSGDPVVTVGRAELTLLAGMVAVAGIIIAVLHPQAVALQARVFAAQEGVEKKAAFEALFRILWPVRSLYMINLVLGILLMGIRAKRSLRREGGHP